MPNIFDQTEKLIHEFAAIREHNAAFKQLYTELCQDDLLKHYKVFSGANRERIMNELQGIEKAIYTIGLNMSSHRSDSVETSK